MPVQETKCSEVELPQNTNEMAESGKQEGQGEFSGGGTARLLTLRRLWPLVVILCGFASFFAFDLDSYVSFEMLKQHREWLLGQVDDNLMLTTFAFVVVYAAIIGFSVPGATIASITGGFLFGLWLGTIVNVISATLGATMLFLAARSVFADILHEKAGPWLRKVESNFNENAASYLLFLRLVPIFPFFAVNLIPAFLGVRLRTFVLTTFFGIIPGGFVYTSFGAGLGAIFDRGDGVITARAVFTPEIVGAMLGLAVLSLLPVAYKFWRVKRPGT